MPPEPSVVKVADIRYMRRALLLAQRGRHTHPNPQVGAVIVQGDRIVGEGWHQGVSTPHAETMAFTAAGDRARGATIYVTLEPCAHTVSVDGSPRTPCALRCITAGVSRVVAALRDPDTRVAGQGFDQLRAAGIRVTEGVEEARAREINRAYLRHRTTGLPYITHKAAMTLDGKIAAPGGDSKWVTGEKARGYVHRLRDRTDALLVGIGTVLADDPSLTTRLPGGRNGQDPLSVIIDSRLRFPAHAKAARPGTLVITTDQASRERREQVEATGAAVAVVEADSEGRVDVRSVARLLGERGELAVLLEGGGRLAAAFWQADLVNRVLYFVAPKIIGGEEATTPVEGAGLSRSMADARNLGKLTVRRFGSDIALEAEVQE